MISLGGGDVFPVILNTSLAVGENRVLIHLIDDDDEPILGSDMSLRFFDLNAEKPELKTEMEARFVPVELGYVDEQSGGERTSSGSDGVYVAYVTFDRPGNWGVKVAVSYEGEELDLPFQFTVLERTAEPGIGDEAPRSIQPTSATVDDLEEIDSSHPLRPHMHDVTIAEAVESGRAAVIAFATPAFCRSRLCAPIMDTVMDPLYERYGDAAAFIHVEPFVLRDLRSGFVQNPIPATREWQLHAEPWIFVVDRKGRIAGKFEGIVAADEVERVLAAAINGR